jgi:hypothetical protein
MKAWAKILGVAGLLAGVLSFTRFGSDLAWGALKPLSAILLGAAFICQLLAPEYAKYDEDQKSRVNTAKREETKWSEPPNRPAREEVTKH